LGGKTVNNVNWGCVDPIAEILTPGATAGDGRCEPGQWGVIAEDIVAYGALAELRAWARSILDQLPASRDGAPLLTVDPGRQWTWLEAREPGTHTDWAATTATIRDLVLAIAADPTAAGWTLGVDVASLWADLDDDTGALVAGVVLASTGHHVGIGEPLTDADLRAPGPISGREWANGCLSAVGERINQSY
jgi:hypothetical protein